MCDKTGNDECATCIKYKEIKPDKTLNYPFWKKEAFKRDKSESNNNGVK